MNRTDYILAGLTGFLMAISPASAETSQNNRAASTATGTTIIGTNEAPTVLNVLPWQGPELSADPAQLQTSNVKSILEESLNPVDRDVLLREVQYFNLLELSK